MSSKTGNVHVLQGVPREMRMQECAIEVPAANTRGDTVTQMLHKECGSATHFSTHAPNASMVLTAMNTCGWQRTESRPGEVSDATMSSVWSFSLQARERGNKQVS